MGKTVVLSVPPLTLQQFGPIIKVKIAHTQLELEEAKTLGFEFPRVLPVNGLIDTGAAVTIINPELAKTYKLHYTGPARIRTAGHLDTYPEYAAAVSFPDRDLQDFEVLRVVACPLASAEMSCLIGRDILRHWEMRYNGQTGHVSIRDLRPLEA